MANHASALKRMRQSQKRRSYNRQYRSAMRTQIRKVREAVAGGDVSAATPLLNQAVSLIQRLAARKVIHKRNASRRVSRLYKALNAAKGANT